MVFYFTGTGNSLYIAKCLSKNPVSIPQVIHQKCLEFTADEIGIVSPVYGHEVSVSGKNGSDAAGCMAASSAGYRELYRMRYMPESMSLWLYKSDR